MKYPAERPVTSEHVLGGDVVVRVLEAFGVTTAFGVISIHNIPMLDAMSRGRTIRFVPARSESGATNMADGYARTRGSLGVVVTSTGPGAGNASGAMTEALTAGTPLLHLTGQIDTADVDRGHGMNHETADQLTMLRAVSKAAFRVRSAAELAPVVTAAIRCALTVPCGPVSVEIPIDIQQNLAPLPAHVPVDLPAPLTADDTSIARCVELLAAARRPLLWIGAGAAHAAAELEALMRRGVGLVTSIHGRGIIPDDHPLARLGAMNNTRAAEALYASCDLLITCGTRMRGNETKKHTLALPKSVVQIDVDIAAWNRNYPAGLFVLGDARDALARIAAGLPPTWQPDAAFAFDLLNAKRAASSELRAAVGPYGALCDVLREAMPRDAVFVRDVTISANTWANRLFPIYDWSASIHALGGGIGQGLQHAIGATFAAGARRVVALCGDGGLAVNIGELATAVQENVDLLLILMNDGGYGVMRNIQDAAYGGRSFYSDLFLPDVLAFAGVMKIPAWRAHDIAEFSVMIREAMNAAGPRILEIDMNAFGAFPVAFAGPRMN